MPLPRLRLTHAALFTLGVGAAGAALFWPRAGDRAPAGPACTAELRSWVVAAPHPGRHLYLQITCPPPYEHLSGRVEFTTAELRADFVRRANTAGPPGVARFTRGAALRPIIGDPAKTDRLEQTYTLTIEQVECLQRDRLWDAPYILVGTNSSSGMRAVLEECGCELPDRVLRGGGVFGPFPGVDLDPGPETPPDLWAERGLPNGPTLPAAPRGGTGVAAR